MPGILGRYGWKQLFSRRRVRLTGHKPVINETETTVESDIRRKSYQTTGYYYVPNNGMNGNTDTSNMWWPLVPQVGLYSKSRSFDKCLGRYRHRQGEKCFMKIVSRHHPTGAKMAQKECTQYQYVGAEVDNKGQ